MVGAAGILGRPPAGWAARQLGVLTAANFAPASDAKLDESAKPKAAMIWAETEIKRLVTR